MGVSVYTQERAQKAKQELEAAQEAAARAMSRLRDAERRHNDAMNAWEREFFAPTEAGRKALEGLGAPQWPACEPGKPSA
jgi:chromosome segregation ATPase